MSACFDVLTRAKRLVMGHRRDRISVTSIAVTSTDLTITVTSTSGIGAGSIIEIGLEQMLVRSFNATQMTVVRGVNGTIPTAHASGAFCLFNPPVYMQELLDCANAELSSLSSPQNGLFRVLHTDISTNLGKIGFDLNAGPGFIDVIAARYRQSNLGDWMPVTGYQILRDADLTDFPSGIGITFPTGTRGTNTTRVWYSTAFGQLASLSEDVQAVTGLPSTAEDILHMGAAIRAVEGREIVRADLSAQMDTRRAAEVPMGNNLQSSSLLRKSRADRIAEEAARLRKQWGRV